MVRSIGTAQLTGIYDKDTNADDVRRLGALGNIVPGLTKSIRCRAPSDCSSAKLSCKLPASADPARSEADRFA